MKKQNVIGMKFGRLTVIEECAPYISPGGQKRRKLLCACSCGSTSEVMVNHLKNGNTTSCGCVAREMLSKERLTHGLSRTRPHRIWNQMVMRCHNVNSYSFKDYGAKGIIVCDKWRTFDGFWEDMKEGYFDGLTIDRKDNEKGYYKENCRWATMKEQQNNRSNNRIITFDGKSQTLMQWSEEIGIKRQTIESRLRRGWTIEKTLTHNIMNNSILK